RARGEPRAACARRALLRKRARRSARAHRPAALGIRCSRRNTGSAHHHRGTRAVLEDAGCLRRRDLPLTGYADPWSVLGIGQTKDKSAIRRAYSTKLKQNHPEDDPEAFKQLRSAYEWALSWTEFDPGEEVDLAGFADQDSPDISAIAAFSPDASTDEQ